MTLARDVRYAARSLRRTPGVAAIGIVSLALAIGANTAIFSVVDAMLWRSLPYRDAGRLAMIWTTNRLNGALEQYTSVLNVHDWQMRSHTFTDMASFREGDGPLADRDPAANVEWRTYAFVTGNFFGLLGRGPAQGQIFGEDAFANRRPVAVLSHRLWQQRFHGAADVIGTSITIGGVDLVVIGVMPADFWFPSKDIDLWMPGSVRPDWLRSRDDRGRRFGGVIARLAPGATVAQADAEMGTIAQQLEREFPATNTNLGARVVPLQVQVIGTSVPFLLAVLFGAVFCVLLIACANVANLLLARGVARGREMAVRMALGAGRWRIARQLLTESLLVAGVGGVFGVLLALWLVRAFVALAPPAIPRLDDVRLDGSVLLFALALSVASGLLFGLAPLLQIARDAQAGSLYSGDRRASTPRPVRRAQQWFVVGQFTLALVLLSGAGLLIRSLLAVHAVESGFADTQNVLTAHLRFDNTLARTRRVALYRQTLERIGQLPGVHAAGAVGTMFWRSGGGNFGLRAVEGRSPESRAGWTPMTWTTISGNYFQALGVPLVRGRYFSDRDRNDSPPVVVINEATAGRYWPGDDAVGQRIKGFDPRGVHDDWVTIIGVVANVHSAGLERQPMAQIFEWQAQSLDETENLVVSSLPGRPADALQQAVREIDRTAVLSEISTLGRTLGEQQAQRRFQTVLLGAFAALALLLAGAGIFATSHHAVAQRTQEIGIRMALGASRASVLRMVLREGMTLATTGVAVGVGGALLLMRTIASLLFGVTPHDPLTFVLVSLIFAAAAIAGCALPARRATKIDAMIALRTESH